MKWNLPVSGLMVAVIGLLIVFNNGCKLNNPFTNDETADLQLIDGNSGQNGKSAPKLTGEVEIVWKGGMGMDSVQAAQPRRAFVSIEAFEPEANRPGHGTCVYTVTDEIGTIHRQIVIDLEGARVDEATAKAWYRGVVVSDTKGCAGGSDGGHSTDCAGDTGGCGEDHDHTSGGCNAGGEDEGHDGGCSGHGGSGGSGGAQVSGRNCRVGQLFVGRAHDGGTPGVRGDGITWKWFDADNPNVPTLDDLSTWQHLCGKTIIDGNLVVHTGAQATDQANQR
jgi:hypothetical protein